MNYDPHDPSTNRRDQFDEIHEIRQVVDKLSGTNWVQKHGALMLAVIVLLIPIAAGYITTGVQVASNTVDIEKKADAEYMGLMFKGQSKEIQNVKDAHRHDINNNAKRFDKLDKTLEKNTDLLQQLIIETKQIK